MINPRKMFAVRNLENVLATPSYLLPPMYWDIKARLAVPNP